MFNMLMRNISTEPDALVGVGLIVVYFIWMMSMSLMRIKRGDHMHH